MSLRLHLIMIAMVCTSHRAAAITEVIRDPKAWDYAPLQYSDIVVRGTVTAVTDSTVSSADFWMNPLLLPQFARTIVSVVKVDVAETLRGPKAVENWSFLVWQEDHSDPARAYPVGKEMLICASVHPRLHRYYHAGVYGRYVSDDGSWKCGPTPRGERTFRDAELRQKVSEMSIESVAEEAELIFVGTIRSTSKTIAQGPNGATADQLNLLFDVEQVRKGRLDAPSVQVVMLTSGMYLPAWGKHVPEGCQEGQRWLCFAKKNEVGWYPFAGSNGFLRIESDRLTYDNRVPFWHEKASVDKIIRSAAEEGEK